jgi:mRNA interferase MazF
MIDKVTTVPRSKLGLRIGQVGATDLRRVDRALTVFLGLAD